VSAAASKLSTERLRRFGARPRPHAQQQPGDHAEHASEPTISSRSAGPAALAGSAAGEHSPAGEAKRTPWMASSMLP